MSGTPLYNQYTLTSTNEITGALVNGINGDQTLSINKAATGNFPMTADSASIILYTLTAESAKTAKDTNAAYQHAFLDGIRQPTYCAYYATNMPYNIDSYYTGWWPMLIYPKLDLNCDTNIIPIIDYHNSISINESIDTMVSTSELNAISIANLNPTYTVFFVNLYHDFGATFWKQQIDTNKDRYIDLYDTIYPYNGCLDYERELDGAEVPQDNCKSESQNFKSQSIEGCWFVTTSTWGDENTESECDDDEGDWKQKSTEQVYDGCDVHGDIPYSSTPESSCSDRDLGEMQIKYTGTDTLKAIHQYGCLYTPTGVPDSEAEDFFSLHNQTSDTLPIAIQGNLHIFYNIYKPEEGGWELISSDGDTNFCVGMQANTVQAVSIFQQDLANAHASQLIFGITQQMRNVPNFANANLLHTFTVIDKNVTTTNLDDRPLAYTVQHEFCHVLFGTNAHFITPLTIANPSSMCNTSSSITKNVNDHILWQKVDSAFTKNIGLSFGH